MSIGTDIAAIDMWIDSNTPPAFKANPILALYGRVAKVGEESGEVMQALIGATGQNPRKGFSHTIDDVTSELADVALTALCAIQHITQDDAMTMQILESKIKFVMNRAELSPVVGTDPAFTTYNGQ
jgi:NTP pyrophosphatase (non-canonical NTP hydrolase)